jgi:hypothetical protein
LVEHFIQLGIWIKQEVNIMCAFKRQSPQPVVEGGTGIQSATAYAPLCGNGTSGFQVASTGQSNAGYVLTSSGSSALPVFEPPSSVGTFVLLKTLTASNSPSLAFTSTYITSAYVNYFINIASLVPATNAVNLSMDWSTNNGSSYLSSDYECGVNTNAWNSASASNSNSTGTCPLNNTSIQVATSYGISGQIFLYNIGTGNITVPMYNAQLFAPFYFSEAFGGNTAAPSVNNIRFSFSSGNISSGIISLYGIAN